MHWIHALTLAAPLAFAPLAASAHGAAHGGPASARAAAPEQKPWGIAGEPRAVTRTFTVTMGDNMRFVPDSLEVREGETVRLVVRNTGKALHELVIGTREELDQHAAMMQKFPNMEHDEPYMAHVAAGKTGQLVWNFNRAGDFEFACLIPGHYQAGMIGKIKVLPAAGR